MSRTAKPAGLPGRSILAALLLFCLRGAAQQTGTEMVTFAGYDNCVRLQNGDTRVTLEPSCGGRILEYAVGDRNALYLDPEQNGKTWSAGDREFDPCGGRCDIGPETVIPPHPLLWRGPWTATIRGPRAARLTSVEDPVTGVQLTRDFELAEHGSHLRFTQTIRNVSKTAVTWCHWSRTLAVGGGLCVIPRTSPSRFPDGYVQYGPGPVINFHPQDPALRQRDGYLEVLDTPQQPKLGMDSAAGWFAYLVPNDLVFVKRFPVFPERVYNEIAGLTISIWYYKHSMCELEPIGPAEHLEAGQSASFTEDWWLLEHPFPKQRDNVDLKALEAFVNSHARIDVPAPGR